MGKIMNALDEFGEECTIHGVRESLSKKYSGASNILWALLFTIAVGFMLSLISNTVTEFLGNPSATNIGIGMMSQFPPITLCPTVWMNDPLAQQIGYTRDMQTYVDSIHFLSPNRYFWMGSLNPAEGYGDPVNWANVLLNMTNLLARRNESLSEILEAISYGPRELLEVVPTDLSTNFSFSKGETVAGMCYRIWDHRVFTRFSIPTAMLVVKITQRVSQLTFNNNPQDISSQLFVGNAGIGAMPLGGYGLIAGTNYQVKVSAQVVTRLADASICSTEAVYTTRSTCLGECLMEKCRKAGFCEIYFPKSRSDISNYCTYMKARDHCIYVGMDEIEMCNNHCVKPCTTLITSVMLSPTTTNPAGSNTSKLVFTLENPTTTIEIRERCIYTVPMLLSNLGGVASLFVGCSVMSFVHAICFWAMKIPKLYNAN